MPENKSAGVDVFVRVGENEELLLATIRDVTSTSAALRNLASELERLAGAPVRLQDRTGLDEEDFYAEDLP